ncbi:GNAT family N-acetyltransferase [Mucilaginibacter sp. ZT4R22]|uniref:GNAT family N-acetyltransferase n=1 Tax=Mucilaginibacter pankratovii TaxID=2772110 RepID=A0ABR7WP36_9SPHI|nr:GNAT family N-acetyltransferase [Mucilaginibacter pankratovii]MBD1364089.1 GNAT family N-acetyltransferase [Mucilaginibacter pankratovii]
MQIFAETDRLILREILPTDAQGMFELDSDPDVHRYLGNKPIETLEEAQQGIAFIRQQYLDYGIGRWAVIEKATSEFTGWAGLKFMTETRNRHTNFYDVGYRFIKRYWGKGYATEAAIASVNYGFDVLKLDELFGMADVDNIGSNKALQKAGLKYVEDFEHAGIRHSWYHLNR